MPDTNGWYNFRSVNDPAHFLFLNGAYGAPYTNPVEGSHFMTHASFFFVCEGKYMQIRDHYSTPFYLYAAPTDQTLDRTTDPRLATWWYLEYDEGKKAYHLCLHEPSRKRSEPVRVLGNVGANTYSTFNYTLPIQSLVDHSNTQLWTIQ